MYHSNVMSRSISILVLLEVIVAVSVESETGNQVSLVDRSLENGIEETTQDNTVDDIWSMVASMQGNADSREAHINDQSSRKSSKLDWTMDLDQNGVFHLDWSVNYAANLITFSLDINQTSQEFHRGSDIFALGFSNYGQLSSSDFCIIWYDLAHRLHLQDARSDLNGRLELIGASKSHCRLVSALQSVGIDQLEDAIEENSKSNMNIASDLSAGSELSEVEQHSAVRIVFTRPLDVCTGAAAGSNNSYYQIDNGTTHLVWFSIKGPLLSLDGLNLKELSRPTRSNSGGGGDGDGNVDNQVTPSDGYGDNKLEYRAKRYMSSRGDNRFSFGMKRVQLIAVKVSSGKGHFEGKEKLAKGKRMRRRRRRNNLSTKGSSSSIEIRMDSFRIPAQETTYWCKLFKFPHKFVQQRYHITRYEAVIEKGNEHVVHHMELFNCANLDDSQELELKQLYESGGWSGDCNGHSRPTSTKPCKRVILAWAMGAHPLEYPEQVGQSVGGLNYSPYVVLEVHYNNVERSSGLIDNSGLSFLYTNKLRPYDAGILEVGLEYSDKNSIPPGQVFPLAGHCVSECTRAAMTEAAVAVQTKQVSAKSGIVAAFSEDDFVEEEKDSVRRSGNRKLATNEAGDEVVGATSRVPETTGGIYIFAAQMHTHLAGVATWTEHIREGRLVGELQRDNHYSPHFQEIRLLSEPVHVLPGDALIHYCLYDTRNRPNITLGGFATSDEMCVTYLHYYPRIDLELCKSSIDTQALEAYFAYLAREERQNTSSRLLESILSNYNKAENDGKDEIANRREVLTKLKQSVKTVKENYQSIHWTPKRARDLAQLYFESPLSVQCNRSNGERFPGYWSGVTPTQVWADLEGSEPFAKRRPNGRQLVEYRGKGFEKRHEQCRSSRTSNTN